MEEFILGMTDNSMQSAKTPDEEIVQFTSKKEAEFESAEWCVVRANNLDEAKANYLAVYEAWYVKGFDGVYPSDEEIEEQRKNLDNE
jgi:hypothetical protein